MISKEEILKLNNLYLEECLYIGFDEKHNEKYYLIVKDIDVTSLDNCYEFLAGYLKDKAFSKVVLFDIFKEHEYILILQVLQRISKSNNIMIYIGTRNIHSYDKLMKAIENKRNMAQDKLFASAEYDGISEIDLENGMKDLGFQEVDKMDVFSKEENHNENLNDNTITGVYISNSLKLINKSAKIDYFFRSYIGIDQVTESNIEEQEIKKPFLSVITRTVAMREEALYEVLLCLAAQSNMDFEILILGHNLKEEKVDIVKRIIGEQEEFFRGKIRYIPVEGGNRTRPLIVGFEEAKGEYISILDDDDIIFEDWVETFYQGFLKHKGSILHTYSINQSWDVMENKYGEKYLTASGSPEKTFCVDFNLLNQLIVNKCPTMSLAFPSYVYKDYEVRFDETLTTTEDWDFLMKAAFICGVTNIQKATSIYRIWEDSLNSYSIHSRREWDRNIRNIQNKFMKMPIAIPVGYSEFIINNEHLANAVKYNDRKILYIDDGTGFSESKSLSTSLLSNHVFFDDFEQYSLVKKLRFDPSENSLIKVIDLELAINFADNTTKVLKTKDATSNGWMEEDMISFIEPDPQIYFVLTEPKKIDFIEVSFKQEAIRNISYKWMIKFIIRSKFKKLTNKSKQIFKKRK